ncbi:MAG: hypothetical protein LBO80_05415 [Treponema sp.]|jgi:hypothetical protein|nr:hypothetical protein [Treponema sp.]
MRIAVINATGNRDAPEYVKALTGGMESMGHRVDIIDACAGDGRGLPGYEYIAAAVEGSFFGGKIPAALGVLLAGAGSLTGKKSAAFVRENGPFTAKALARVMAVMEKEGMCVNWSDRIRNSAHAENLGKMIGN